MNLETSDQSRLAQILVQARELEKEWPRLERHETRRLGGDPRYQELKRLISVCSRADAESLRRLADRAAHLHDEISLNHFYGCIVPFERLANRTVRDDEFLVAEGDRPARTVGRVPLKIVIENLRSAFNVGAVFRTAECLGASEIVLCGYTPGPDDEKTAHTAMGTSSSVPWRRADRAGAACEELRAQGYKIVALETAENATSLHQFHFGGAPTAFVLGNERFGVERDTLRGADAICRIPVRGAKNSLNVGIAFGVCAFEWLRQWEKP